MQVEPLRARPYTPTQGKTQPVPKLGHSSTDPSDYLFPKDIDRVEKYIYPWINSTDLSKSSSDPDYGLSSKDYVPEGATDGSAQNLLPAGGAAGGNAGLYDDIYEVSAVIENTGHVTGEEVPQVVSVFFFFFCFVYLVITVVICYITWRTSC